MAHENSGLQNRLQEDLKAAMRARDEARVSTLRLLIADLKNLAIEKMGTPTASDELALLSRHKKQREESIAAFEGGGRLDLATREKAELVVLLEYLPQQLSREEVEALIRKVIAEVGATSKKEMGKVMGKLMPETKGRFPGEQLKALVEAALG
jgi:uncharacterized protein YqeY